MLNSYRTYFASGLETLKRLESVLDNAQTLPEPVRGYSMPSKEKNVPTSPPPVVKKRQYVTIHVN